MEVERIRTDSVTLAISASTNEAKLLARYCRFAAKLDSYFFTDNEMVDIGKMLQMIEAALRHALPVEPERKQPSN